MPWHHLFSACLYLLASLCLYVFLVNRVLSPLYENKFKAFAFFFSFVGFAVGSVGASIFLPRPPWIYIPIGVLGLGLIGEVRRLFIRRMCVSTAPVDTTPHRIELSHPLTTGDLACHRYVVSLPFWAGRNLRIAHMTDLHVALGMNLDLFERAFAMVEAADPDLVFITGDFITKRSGLSVLPYVLRPLGRLGSYAVLGNHDYWSAPDEVRDLVQKSGIRVLTNASVVLDLDGHLLRITGFDGHWAPGEERIAQAEAGALHLVLSHAPDNIYPLAKLSASCVFSGHHHGGQIRFPLIGPVVIPSAYGRRFDHGHFEVHGTHLFVASGVGASLPTFRMYCEPDIFLVDIQSLPKGFPA